MRKLVYEWLGREFVALSAEGRPELGVAEQARDLFRRFDEELRGLGLSLDDTVRTRLWGRERASRDEGSRERVAALAGRARSASSSYIAPAHFDSDAQVAVDLYAMRPRRSGLEKALVEYDPPIVPLRYLAWDQVVVLSGVTAVLPTLADQVADILPRIEASLADADAGWGAGRADLLLPPPRPAPRPAQGPARRGHPRSPPAGRVRFRGRLLHRGEARRDRGHGAAHRVGELVGQFLCAPGDGLTPASPRGRGGQPRLPAARTAHILASDKR